MPLASSPLGIEAVAMRAGVNKTTIYRRWPNKDILMLAVLAREGHSIFHITQTDNVRSELIQIAQQLAAQIRTPQGQAIYITVIQHGPGAGNVPVPQEISWLIRTILQRAIKRGDLPAHTDLDLLLSSFLGTVIQFSLFTAHQRSMTEQQARRIVSMILAGNEALAQQTSPATHQHAPQKGKPTVAPRPTHRN